MKIQDFGKVNTLMDQRASLMADLSAARAIDGNGLGVTINGRYQDKEMLLAVREAVIEEFKRRIRIIETDLKTYGVTL